MLSLLAMLLLVCGLLLVWVSLDLDGKIVRASRREPDVLGPSSAGWGIGTRYFLVLLRLAIGWHFLVEGWDKLNNPSWSSEAYLREATGPLASRFRALADDSLVERVTVVDQTFPGQLAVDWNTYFEAFKAHYELDEKKVIEAKSKMDQARSKTLTWLTTEKTVLNRPLQQGVTVAVAMTVPERLDELAKKEALVETIEDSYRTTFGPATFAKLRDAKGDVRRVRAELQADLAKQTTDMKKSLESVLTDEQKKLPAVPEPERSLASWGMREWTDNFVKFGLVAVGACLLAGLLTRTACIGGALFLLLFYLAMPPLPGWPESPRSEGHYLFINKNIIEMLALLALATTRSGRWAGLDGLLQFLRRRRDLPAAPETSQTQSPPPSL